MSQPPIEVNEIGPTIQPGVIQCPVQRGIQSTDVRQMNAAPLVDTRQTVARVPSSNTTDASAVSDPGEDGRNRPPEQERDPNHNGYVLNCVHENRPLTLNDVARPVFVNHYYAGESFIPTTSKKLIKLDECDASTDNSIRNIQSQGTEHECREYSRNSPARQQPRTQNRYSQPKENNSDMHNEFPEHSRNLLRIAAASQKGVPMQGERNINRGIQSEFTEHSLGALNIGKSRVQATYQINSHQIPLTGYENFCQELQMYPVSRDPMMVQPAGLDNVSSSVLLDLPNVNTNLPPPLVSNPSPHHEINQMEITNPGQVTNSEILKSIQSITEVMQQQLLLNSKTTKQGIVQTASLFQEMIKAQEKRDLDPALLVIPMFSGETADRPQCLDWVSRVKNVCDQSGHSFRQELINKSGILVQNFIRSLNEKITNNELTEKILQFFSDVLTTSHALNKL